MATRSGKTLAISPPFKAAVCFPQRTGRMSRRDAGAFGSIACSLFIQRRIEIRERARLLTRTYLQKRKQGPFGAQFGATCTRASNRPSRVCAEYARMRVGATRITCDPQVARTHRNPLKLLRPKTGQFSPGPWDPRRSVATSARTKAGSGATIAAADRRTRQSEVLGGWGICSPDSDPRSVEKGRSSNRWVWSLGYSAERPWPYAPIQGGSLFSSANRGG